MIKEETIAHSSVNTYKCFVFLFLSQGIVAGPSGVAEGVARGVKSLLGHVIGILEDKFLGCDY